MGEIRSAREIALEKAEKLGKATKEELDRAKYTPEGAKQDKASLENIFSKIRRLFEHYEGQGEQQRRQGYEMFKQEFEARVRQAMQQQGMMGAGRLDVGRTVRFAGEWGETYS